MIPIALTIAGSDPSGGAGIQADLKTFHQFGVYGEAVITLITAQNTQSVIRVDVLQVELVRDQILAVMNDIPPVYAKTGALGSPEIVRLVAEMAAKYKLKLIVDPVMVSKHGASLMSAEARRALVEHLLPRTYLLTPNLHEAMELTQIPSDEDRAVERMAEALAGMGPEHVLVKGGHRDSDPAVDVYFSDGMFREYHAERIATKNTHGTGCTYSAAITAELAKGAEMPDAIARAKRYVTEAIRTNPNLGRGHGPLNHHART